MSLKAKIEALIYAAEDPITPDQLAALLKDDLQALANAAASPEPEGPQEPMFPAAEESSPAAAPAPKRQKSEKTELRERLSPLLDELIADYSREDRGIEIRQVAGGYRMSTKPEHHDAIRAFAKSLKPPIRLSLPALETLAVIAYRQPVTVPEISDVRGVDSSGVIGTLLERKLIATAGRKAVVGRPMLYKTSKDFLLRFGLKDLGELPSLEEFEKLAASELQDEPASSRPEDGGAPGAEGIAEADGAESDGHGAEEREAQDHEAEAHGAEAHGAQNHGAADHTAEDHGAQNHRAADHGAEDEGAHAAEVQPSEVRQSEDQAVTVTMASEPAGAPPQADANSSNPGGEAAGIPMADEISSESSGG